MNPCDGRSWLDGSILDGSVVPVNFSQEVHGSRTLGRQHPKQALGERSSSGNSASACLRVPLAPSERSASAKGALRKANSLSTRRRVPPCLSPVPNIRRVPSYVHEIHVFEF